MIAAIPLLFLLLAAPPEGPSPDPRSLAVSAADQSKALKLIRKLGSPFFPDREEATKELRGMGRLALVALKKAATSDADPEIRFRSDLLIPAASDADYEARLSCFLADRAGKFEHDIPGWKEFLKAADNDPLARPLFYDLLKSDANRFLLAGLSISTSELNRRVLERRAALYEQMYPRPVAGEKVERYEPDLVDTAGLIFCESQIPDKSPQRGMMRMASGYTILLRINVRNLLANDRYGATVRKLVITWLDTRENATTLNQAQTIASQLGLDNSAKYAGKLLACEGTTALQRASAAANVARLGTSDDVGWLKPLMNDETVVRNPFNGLADIQVRDVALAMACHMTNRDPASYGMLSNSPASGSKYSYYNFVFPSAESRDLGHAKFAKDAPELIPKK